MRKLFSTLRLWWEARRQYWDDRLHPDVPPTPFGVGGPEWRSFCLLIRSLSRRQRRQLLKTGYFMVRTQGSYRDNQGERVGPVRVEYGGNYSVTRPDKYSARYQFAWCVLPAIQCPIWDSMLMNKLYLEANPRAFFRCANTSHLDVETIDERRARCLKAASRLMRMYRELEATSKK
jgi:hypothetical protein